MENKNQLSEDDRDAYRKMLRSLPRWLIGEFIAMEQEELVRRMGGEVKDVDIPPCLGFSTYEGDYDCKYGVPWECESCLCNYEIGGRMDPRTPEKYESDDDD
jgi:hypothetical protein